MSNILILAANSVLIAASVLGLLIVSIHTSTTL
jgi:hypothetical protein